MNVTRLTKYIAPALFLGLILFSCKKKDEEKPAPEAVVSPDVRIVATVNGDPITLAEFQERFARAGFKPDQGVALGLKRIFSTG
jgi:hypothetical protein